MLGESTVLYSLENIVFMKQLCYLTVRNNFCTCVMYYYLDAFVHPLMS